MELPDIGLVYCESFPEELVSDFKNSLEGFDFKILTETRADDEAYACTEWFIPTAVMLFLSKPYVETIMSKLAEDHYDSVKKTFARLTTKTMSKPRIEPVIIGTPGKLSNENPFSLAFSIYAQANDGNTFKLLLPKPSEKVDYTKIIYSFLDFLNNYHSGVKYLSDIGCPEGVRYPSNTIFVHVNTETGKVEWLDATNN